jgi:hypothetical protein
MSSDCYVNLQMPGSLEVVTAGRYRRGATGDRPVRLVLPGSCG